MANDVMKLLGTFAIIIGLFAGSITILGQFGFLAIVLGGDANLVLVNQLGEREFRVGDNPRVILDIKNEDYMGSVFLPGTTTVNGVLCQELFLDAEKQQRGLFYSSAGDYHALNYDGQPVTNAQDRFCCDAEVYYDIIATRSCTSARDCTSTSFSSAVSGCVLKAGNNLVEVKGWVQYKVGAFDSRLFTVTQNIQVEGPGVTPGDVGVPVGFPPEAKDEGYVGQPTIKDTVLGNLPFLAAMLGLVIIGVVLRARKK